MLSVVHSVKTSTKPYHSTPRVCTLFASVVHLGPGEERSEDAVMMNTPVIKSALEMGFERSLVKQTVQSKILTSGENYRTVQELVSDLLSAEDQKREEEREMLAEAMASGAAARIYYRLVCMCCQLIVSNTLLVVLSHQ